MTYHSKTFGARARNYWACVSQLLNQTLHFGGAPYPLTLSEMCYRETGWQYKLGERIINGAFALFGERDHCALAWRNGTAAAIHRQRIARDLPTSDRVYKEGFL